MLHMSISWFQEGSCKWPQAGHWWTKLILSLKYSLSFFTHSLFSEPQATIYIHALCISWFLEWRRKLSQAIGELVWRALSILDTFLFLIFTLSPQVGGARNGSYGGARQHRGSGGNGGMVMSTATAPAAPNNVYYHYVPVPNPPLYYTQPQQYPTSPVSWTVQDLNNVSNIY